MERKKLNGGSDCSSEWGPKMNLSCWAQARESQNRDSGPEMELGFSFKGHKFKNCLIHL